MTMILKRTQSKEGLQFLKSVEGSKLKAYVDVAGHLTIGVGHKLTAQELKTKVIVVKGKAISWSNGISQEDVDDLLDQDTNYFEKVINVHIKTQLSQNQFDALVSFVFNVGASAFLSSTLLRKINAQLLHHVPGELLKWNKITDPQTKKKVMSRGLSNRRTKEINLWLGQYS